MFVRIQRNGPRRYLLVVENEWVDGQVKQKVLHRLGRLDLLQETGKLDALMLSMQRFSAKLAVLGAQQRRQVQTTRTRKIGPALIFDRLWQSLRIAPVLKGLLRTRRFQFSVERVIFLTVLHRLMVSGSDRSAEQWRQDYAIAGVGELGLHQVYRAMAWLGEPLAADKQGAATPLAPRCTKDLIEEALFAQRRDLFSGLDLVFFDTTSLYFEGQGGETMGAYGKSKDHRPDRKQMVVGVVLDGQGRPICCELWPGNTADVTTLVPVVDRLQERFGIRRLCLVADRGMIRRQTLSQLQHPARDVRYILGARMRAVKEVRQIVLSDNRPYQTVYGPKTTSKDPSPLAVKEVKVDSRRYVVCYNEDQARKDRADRQAIVEHLRDQLQRGDKSLVGNKGYRKYLKTTPGPRFEIDDAKIEQEAQYDGIWVLQTDLDLEARQVALRYKELWMVETIFRSLKSILETRPIFHKCDETIRGHVFCSFLALLLRKELQDRLEGQGWSLEWAEVVRDLDTLVEMDISVVGKAYTLRSETKGTVDKVFKACGVALPPIFTERQAPAPSPPPRTKA